MKKRINLELPQDLGDKLDIWSVKWDMPKTSLINLSIRAGLDAIIRTMSPQDAYTPEQMADIVQALKLRGIDISETDKDKEN